MIRQILVLATTSLGVAFGVSAAYGNNLGENYGWQFQSTADKVNQAVLQDLIQKRKNGYYAAPIYTTNIDRQYNCNVGATAQGNQGTNSTIAGSPSTTGAGARALGNSSDADIVGPGEGAAGADTDQINTGSVTSHVHGSTSTSVRNSSWQALNSEQTNTGNQTASVTGSAACQFGAME